jgi:hypothetical protein
MGILPSRETQRNPIQRTDVSFEGADTTAATGTARHAAAHAETSSVAVPSRSAAKQVNPGMSPMRAPSPSISKPSGKVLQHEEQNIGRDSVEKHKEKLVFEEISAGRKLEELAKTNGNVIPKVYRLNYTRGDRSTDFINFRKAYMETMGKGQSATFLPPQHLFHGTNGVHPENWESLVPRSGGAGFWAVAPGKSFFEVENKGLIHQLEMGEMSGPIAYAGEKKRFITVWRPNEKLVIAEDSRTISSEEKTYHYNGFPVTYTASINKAHLVGGATKEFNYVKFQKSKKVDLGIAYMAKSHPQFLADALIQAGLPKVGNSAEEMLSKYLGENDLEGLADYILSSVGELSSDTIEKLQELTAQGELEADCQLKAAFMPDGLPYSMVVGQADEKTKEEGATYTLHGSDKDRAGVQGLTLVAIYELPAAS